MKKFFAKANDFFAGSLFPVGHGSARRRLGPPSRTLAAASPFLK
jgi:hypothetical protein